MTHEELLTTIDANSVPFRRCVASLNNALRAVVELHKPTERTPGYSYGPYCTHEVGYEWPCPTIQAIQKALS